MCTEKGYETYDTVKKSLNYCIIIIWINNSTFSLVTLSLKIIEYVKSKISGKKVEPEEKFAKRIIITNLFT